MSKLPTAEELSDANEETLEDLSKGRSEYQYRMMRAFAKIHVQDIIDEIKEQKTLFNGEEGILIKSILTNALTNIK